MSSTEKTKLHLLLRAKDLRKIPQWGKPNCYAEVTLMDADASLANDSKLSLRGDDAMRPYFSAKTEVVLKSTDPVWPGVFIFDYRDDYPLSLYVDVYHKKRNKNDLLLGSTKFTIDKNTHFDFPFNTEEKKLSNNWGTIITSLRKETSDTFDDLRISMRGFKLRNVEDGILGRTGAPKIFRQMRLLGKSDPFFEISRRLRGHGMNSEWRAVARSDYVKSNLSPCWNPVTVNLFHLCDCDEEMELKISIFDYDSNGIHTPMGSFNTTVTDLFIARDANSALPLNENGALVGVIFITDAEINPFDGVSDDTDETRDDNDGGAHVANMGLADIDQEKIISTYSAPRPTFLDYIDGGLKLQISFAIDFSLANEDHHHPLSSHYLHSDGTLNDYEKVILAMGSMVSKYNPVENIPIWGFGAERNGRLANGFQVGPSSGVKGIDGALENYRAELRSDISMSDHALLTEVIDIATKKAHNDFQCQDDGGQNYTILFILTRGVVDDIDATKFTIEASNSSPLSIIIIGIEGGDFGEIRTLVNSVKKHPEGGRNITEFVEFYSHLYSPNAFKDVPLPGVPNQLVDFFYQRNIMPLPKLPSGKVLVFFQEQYVPIAHKVIVPQSTNEKNVTKIPSEKDSISFENDVLDRPTEKDLPATHEDNSRKILGEISISSLIEHDRPQISTGDELISAWGDLPGNSEINLTSLCDDVSPKQSKETASIEFCDHDNQATFNIPITISTRKSSLISDVTALEFCPELLLQKIQTYPDLNTPESSLDSEFTKVMVQNNNNTISNENVLNNDTISNESGPFAFARVNNLMKGLINQMNDESLPC